MKPLFWAGSALQDLRVFPEDARRIAGHELHLVQQGLEPDDWKAMVGIGPGVYELRIRTTTEHREVRRRSIRLVCLSEEDAADCPTGP